MDDLKYEKIEALLVHTAALTSLCYAMLGKQMALSEEEANKHLKNSVKRIQNAINGKGKDNEDKEC